MKNLVAFEQATRLDMSRCLAELQAWLPEVETKANILEVLSCTLEGQQGVTTTKRRTTRGKSKPPITQGVWGSS